MHSHPHTPDHRTGHEFGPGAAPGPSSLLSAPHVPDDLEIRLRVDWAGNEFEPPAVARTGGPLFGSHFENVPRVGAWAAYGVCRHATAAFFPERGQRFDTALAFCRACPVVEPCRAYGLAHSSLKGIFGGLTEDERRRMRSESRRARPPHARGRDRLLFDALHALLRYPVRTWASIAWAGDRFTVARVERRLGGGAYPVPPGRWEYAVLPALPVEPGPDEAGAPGSSGESGEGAASSGWELWCRLLERDVPSLRRPAPVSPPARVAVARPVRVVRDAIATPPPPTVPV